MRKLNNINTNINHIQNYAIQMQGKKLKEDEDINVLDMKEMFNEIDIDKSLERIRKLIDTNEFNQETLTEMVEYDFRSTNLALYNGK